MKQKPLVFFVFFVLLLVLGACTPEPLKIEVSTFERTDFTNREENFCLSVKEGEAEVIIFSRGELSRKDGIGLAENPAKDPLSQFNEYALLVGQAEICLTNQDSSQVAFQLTRKFETNKVDLLVTKEN